MSFEILLALFAVAVAAGFVDSIAGGGGILTLPALLTAGLSPVQSMATNKVQAVFGSFSAALHFVRKGHVDLRSLRWAIVCVFVASGVGSVSVQMIDAKILMDVIPFLLGGVGLYFLFAPGLGDSDAHQRMSIGVFSISLAPLIGFYDGFFGPGTGSFFAVAFVVLLGFNLRKATAHTKVLNFTSNFASLIFFVFGGQVVWSIGLVMAVGQFIGAQIGARLVISRGAKLIRPLLVVVSLALTIKVVFF